MAHTALPAEDIGKGAAVIKRLADGNFPLVQALWKPSADTGEWRLMLGTPLANGGDTTGARARLESALGSAPDVPFEKIMFLPESDPLINGNGGMAEFRDWIKDSTFNNLYIEDAYFYER